MPTVSAEYQKKVLEDIRSYGGISHPVHAGLPERLFVRRVKPAYLHPNPDDEFSQVKIGPNFGIVQRYEEQFRHNISVGINPVEEKLIVEKMSVGGYMLMNGHHRWLAATRVAEIKALPVKVVNVSTSEEIISQVQESQREMCVSFDLDEVLMTDGSVIPAERKLIFPFSCFYPKILRKNAAALIHSLHRLGCDVWVYTGQFYSCSYIRRLFRLYGCRVDGIANGMKNKKYCAEVRQAFREKYAVSIHIDGESVLYVNTRTGEYDSRALQGGISWASDAFAAVKQLVKKQE